MGAIPPEIIQKEYGHFVEDVLCLSSTDVYSVKVEKGPHLGQAHGQLKKAMFHVKKKKKLASRTEMLP